MIDEVENNPAMQRLWTAYQKKFSYAADVGWSSVMTAARELCTLIKPGITMSRQISYIRKENGEK